MSGNTIGKLFTVTTCGESHGPAMAGIVDGCPPGLPLSEADLQQDVDRRRSGTSHFVSQRREGDRVRILSGVFDGVTTGTPIGIAIDNEDARSRDYDRIRDRFRPGHADYTYQQKYGVRDYRGGGRSSARETVMRTAAGAIARRYLAARLGVRIRGYLSQVGSLVLEPIDPDAGEHGAVQLDPQAGGIGDLNYTVYNRIWSFNHRGRAVEIVFAPRRAGVVRHKANILARSGHGDHGGQDPKGRILDAESAKYRLELPVTLTMLWAHYQDGASPPLLECSSRTVAMIYILDSLGIRSRMVNVFSSDFTTLRSHTFLEAYNPDNGHWEIQDPDYDVYYVYKGTTERVSTTQLLLEPLDRFQILSKYPDQVDTAGQSVLPHYFQAVVFHDDKGGTSIGMVNTSRYKFKGAAKDLYGYVKKSYGTVPFLTVQEFENQP